ncbi:hypothetical protein AB4Z46_29615 [Variovorax sp. M-6]|uniref:hypothetical protein n=1 Tax=Variovorax sp. M-6 TaxID=3233041 RepID=UPI003F990138
MSFHIEGVAKRQLPASASLAGVLLLVLALTACGGGDSNSNAMMSPASVGVAPEAKGVACKDYDGNQMVVKPKTITIFNNSDKTIYPVLATSKNAVNEWIQGCFRTKDKLYPTDYVYKLYVNEGEGIPKNSSVVITLPLYSELSAERYITWWNGGRVVLADDKERLRGQEDTKLATPGDVSCQGAGTGCALSVYSSAVQFPENIYAQLSEYTFGDSIIPAGQSARLLKTENVGYNISYVDHVYMPVAIGPKNNPYIGYSGSTQSLASFRSRLRSFLESSSGQGWPVYNLGELKLPGGYNIFAQRSGVLPLEDNVPVKPAGISPPVLTVLSCINGQCSEEQKKNLRFGEAVQRIQNLWGSCVAWGGEDISRYVTEKIECPQDLKQNLAVVKQFFEQNHSNYLQMYGAGKCEGSKPLKPEFNYWEAVTHIYGWVPFNEGCGAAANPLADTKIVGWDHAKIQPMYIHELQYNHTQASVIGNSKLTFNPYVKLIHDDLQMNAYAFSVDDAVGFMSELGDGLIFAVGGAKGLENEKQFNYANGFSLAIGVPQSMTDRANSPLIKKYGVCALRRDASDMNCEKDKQDVAMPGDSQIAGFRVGTVVGYPVKIRFTDMNDNVYAFVASEEFALCTDDMNPSQCPANREAIIKNLSCSVTDKNGGAHPKSSNWCKGANPNQQREKQLTKNYLSFPQPVDFMN